MSLYNWLMDHRTKEQLAKELAKTALDNAHYRNRVHELETEMFWLKVNLNKEKQNDHS